MFSFIEKRYEAKTRDLKEKTKRLVYDQIKARRCTYKEEMETKRLLEAGVPDSMDGIAVEGLDAEAAVDAEADLTG